MEQENEEMITYRLDKIDSTLEELKEIVVETKLQRNDINLIKDDIIKLRDSTNRKVDKYETELNAISTIISELKNADDKKAADKWRFIIDSVFKFVVAGVIAAFLGGWL